jgi:hypothetical protein
MRISTLAVAVCLLAGNLCEARHSCRVKHHRQRVVCCAPAPVKAPCDAPAPTSVAPPAAMRDSQSVIFHDMSHAADVGGSLGVSFNGQMLSGPEINRLVEWLNNSEIKPVAGTKRTIASVLYGRTDNSFVPKFFPE